MKSKPSAAGGFGGFSEEALLFLQKLAKNNKRDWFLPRKGFFEEHLQAPMTQLMFAVERELTKSDMRLRVNPKSATFRIYRDIRFSADKTPYHTHISGVLYRNGNKSAPGALYVHIGDKEHFTGAGFWQPERSLLTNWRLSMQDEQEMFLSVIKQLKRKKLDISRSSALQRMPRGFETMNGKPVAEFLRLQSFTVRRMISSSEAMSRDLPGQIARFALDAKPLLDYGWALPEVKRPLFAE